MDNTEGYIFNIQKFCVHDGPGIRTTVFLQGCPLKCGWCSNPESQAKIPQLGYKIKECQRCHRCLAACPHAALDTDKEGYIIINREVCNRQRCTCNGIPSCVAACHSEAIVNFGKVMTAKDIVDEVEKDSAFYSRSGGGLTLSGGEVLFQPRFSLDILTEARKRGIHTTIETSALASKEIIHKICEQLSYLIMDIKIWDENLHEQWTGVKNAQIMRNYLYIREKFPDLPIKIRTPLIPDVNDNEKELEQIVDFLKLSKPSEYELLPFHALGENKYTYLGQDYDFKEKKLPGEKEEELKAFVQKALWS